MSILDGRARIGASRDASGDPAAVDIGEVVEHGEGDQLLDGQSLALGLFQQARPSEALDVKRDAVEDGMIAGLIRTRRDRAVIGERARHAR